MYLSVGRTPHTGNDVNTRVKQQAPPICALMLDKLPDPASNALNQANFANLSRKLLDHQVVSLSACFVCSILRTHSPRSRRWRLGVLTIC